MIILPAIDLKDNSCVRLCQGEFDNVKVYSNNPLDIALGWKNQGATYLHMVDLDGAKSERMVNKESIESIVKNSGLKVELGGGIRTKEDVKFLLELGVHRVILGTMAVENRELLKELVDEYKDRIVVSIDAKNGKVALKGWKLLSDVDSLTLCKELEEIGVQTILYTDILKDGMLQGPNFEVYKEISEKTSLNLIASGGISTLDDIKKLQHMNVYGVIVGKALYEKRFELREVFQCLQRG